MKRRDESANPTGVALAANRAEGSTVQMANQLYRHTENGTELFYPRTTADHVDVDGTALSEVLGEMDAGIDGKAATFVTAAALPVSAWSASGGVYVQTVQVSGLLETDTPIADVDMSGVTSETYAEMAEGWSCVGRMAAGAGSITAYCYENVPTADLTVMLKVVR